MTRLFRRLMYVILRSSHDRDLRDEIEAHRAHRQDALERRGLDSDAAARASRTAMGNVTAAVEDVREVWIARVLDQAWQDLRIAVRGLYKSPAFTLVAICTLTLGIGANTALFSIFNSLILRPLPVREPDTLAVLTNGSWSYPIWRQFQAREGALFDGAVAWSNQTFDLSRGGPTDLVDGAYVSGRFFEVLGVSAVRGRVLTSADDVTSGPDGPVAVISDRYWRRQFGGAPDVVGRQITIQRVPVIIVGVMPPGFFGVDVGRMTDVMVPFAAEPLIRGQETYLTAADASWLDIIVRLKPGQTLAQTNVALRGVQPQIRAATIAGISSRRATRYLMEPLTLAPASTGYSGLRRQFQTPLSTMAAVVGLVLLVACANIASLLVARALARRRELTVRLALGGSRWRLARLLFTESLVIAAVGAALGLLFASWSSALLVRQLSTWQSTVTLDLAVDRRVLAFTAVVTCLSAMVAGVAPVLGLRSVAPGEALKNAGRGVVGDNRFALRGALVVGQIAVTLVLIVAGGLFLRTFASLSRLPLGFDPEPVLIAQLNLLASGVPIEQRPARVARLRDAAAAVPGARSASVAAKLVLAGGGWGSNRIAVDDQPMTPEDRSEHRLWRNATTPGWFDTMGIPLVSGRDFTDRDGVGTPLVAIVNQAFLRRYRLRQPIGHTVRVGDSNGETRYEIVGLVGDAVYTSPRDGMVATLYVPLAQRDVGAFWPTVQLTIRAAPGRRAAVERDVAAALARTDAAVAVTFRNFNQLIDATVTQERLVAMLSSFVGGLALLLAGLGLYGIVAQAVRMRQSEIGLRMALGAAPAGILALVFQRVMVLVAAGLVVGFAGSLWAAQFVAPLLFRVTTRDPMTFTSAAGVLLAVGLLAGWLPARRAARLDPATVLREG